MNSATAAIRRALDQPLELKYDSVPLEKVAADLEAKLGIPVRLDHRAIKDAKTKPNAPVKFAVASLCTVGDRPDAATARLGGRHPL